MPYTYITVFVIVYMIAWYPFTNPTLALQTFYASVHGCTWYEDRKISTKSNILLIMTNFLIHVTITAGKVIIVEPEENSRLNII